MIIEKIKPILTHHGKLVSDLHNCIQTDEDIKRHKKLISSFRKEYEVSEKAVFMSDKDGYFWGLRIEKK